MELAQLAEQTLANRYWWLSLPRWNDIADNNQKAGNLHQSAIRFTATCQWRAPTFARGIPSRGPRPAEVKHPLRRDSTPKSWPLCSLKIFVLGKDDNKLRFHNETQYALRLRGSPCPKSTPTRMSFGILALHLPRQVLRKISKTNCCSPHCL